MFTDISSEVIEFKSTFKFDRTVQHVSKNISTDSLPAKKDISTSTNESKEMATQTENSSGVLTSSSSVVQENLLQFLRKITPLVEKELKIGATSIYDFHDTSEFFETRFVKYQTISLKNVHLENQQLDLVKGTATWLSLATQNAPLLALSCSTVHESWCEHNAPCIIVFIPKRTKDVENSEIITFTEMIAIPVKSCIQVLSTNPFNKDMFAGGTVLGNLYIFAYNKNDPSSTIKEIFSDTTQYGEIVAMAWMKLNPIPSDVITLLTCHKDGIILNWKIGKKTINCDKFFQISSRQKSLSEASSSNENNLKLTSIIAISENEFVVGSEDGRLMLCSATQLLTIRNNTGGKKNHFDPVLLELEAHKFAVTSLHKMNYKNKLLLISCDLSGEIYFHDMTTDFLSPESGAEMSKNEPNLIIKMPLPFKNKIALTKDLSYILSPAPNGDLDIFQINSGTRNTIKDDRHEKCGKGTLISVSDNGDWLITGVYNGDFNIFKILKDF